MTFPDRHLTPTAITRAQPPEVTKTAHGLVDGQRVRAAGFNQFPPGSTTGMEALDGREFVVNVTSADTFELYDIYGNAIDARPYAPFVANGLAKFTLTGPDLDVQNTA